MSAEKWYQQISSKITTDHLDRIADFYDDWKGQEIIDIKFRFLKIVARKKDSDELYWWYLHQLVNKRRIENDELPEILSEIIKDGIYPLRIFHSCTEWLAPNEVYQSDNPRIIRSGIIPFENDDDIVTSLQTACQLNSLVEDPIFVFSGNKSIHTWVKFNAVQLDEEQIAYADQREKAERKARHTYYQKIQKQISFTLDNRISADTRRVVPILNSLNGFTGRKVIQINPSKICSIDSEKLLHISKIDNWIDVSEDKK